jgi:hypothetical protein
MNVGGTSRDSWSSPVLTIPSTSLLRGSEGGFVYTGAIEGGQGVSQEAVVEILALVLRDRTFAERLRTDPDGALGDFDLTEWEREAILLGAHQPSQTTLLEERPRTATRLL